jgi:hypothetical protein
MILETADPLKQAMVTVSLGATLNPWVTAAVLPTMTCSMGPEYAGPEKIYRREVLVAVKVMENCRATLGIPGTITKERTPEGKVPAIRPLSKLKVSDAPSVDGKVRLPTEPKGVRTVRKGDVKLLFEEGIFHQLMTMTIPLPPVPPVPEGAVD